MTVDTHKFSRRELERITRKFVDKIHDLFGPDTDIPAPDMGTGPETMAWIANQYEKYHGFAPACVTGKPVELYGLPGRDEATGRGVGISVTKLLSRVGRKPQNTTVAIQGFGNVGTHTARFLRNAQCKVVAVADASGDYYRRDGLDVNDLLKYAANNKNSLAGYKNAEFLGTSAKILELDVDLLIPAALGGVLTAENAPRVKAKLIVEAANGPTDPEADEIFDRNGITVLPDILANAGGVTASYFEWVQNRQYYRWGQDRVRQELDRAMAEAFESVWQIAAERKTSLRTAAFMLGISRVAQASKLGGYA
ncbi:MAG: Glu/Leu/Phe/Val dehydrogenase dimerization domain-containing protein [Pirellulales bacterium]